MLWAIACGSAISCCSPHADSISAAQIVTMMRMFHPCGKDFTEVTRPAMAPAIVQPAIAQSALKLPPMARAIGRAAARRRTANCDTQVVCGHVFFWAKLASIISADFCLPAWARDSRPLVAVRSGTVHVRTDAPASCIASCGTTPRSNGPPVVAAAKIFMRDALKMAQPVRQI